MWHKTTLTSNLGIEYPIVQGPFGGGYSSVELTALVSNSGGLGSFGAQHLPPQDIIQVIEEIRLATSKPFAINLWVSALDEAAFQYSDEEFNEMALLFQPWFERFDLPLPAKPSLPAFRFSDQVNALLDARPPVFSFVYGIPGLEILEECRKRSIKTMGTATTPDEAKLLEEAGVDIIVATGLEAGGHRVSFLRPAEQSLTGSFSLIPQVRDLVKVPVVAAGGISDARGIAAALILGADGVQIGTAFLACDQSNASKLHKKALFSKAAHYTTLTKLFTGRLARGSESALSEQYKNLENRVAPFPIQSAFMRPLRSKIIELDEQNIFSFWAGQSASLIKHTDAKILFDSLVEETGRILK